MPASLKLEKDHYIIEYSGIVELKETIHVYDALARNPYFDDVRFGIIDCREMIRVAYDPRDFHIHAAYVKAVSSILKRDEFRVAIVVSNEEAETGVKTFVKATEKFKSSLKRQVFWDYGEAIDWATEVAS